MPKLLHVTLTTAQITELVDARDHHPKAYLREKSAAILKIAVEGLSALQVAEHGLLKRRDDNTVRRWLTRYLQEGLAGLLVRRGRGRKPAFSPSGGGAGQKVRIAACVDATTGRVVWRRRGTYTVKEMYRFFSSVNQQDPQARVIYMACGYLAGPLSRLCARASGADEEAQPHSLLAVADLRTLDQSH